MQVDCNFSHWGHNTFLKDDLFSLETYSLINKVVLFVLDMGGLSMWEAAKQKKQKQLNKNLKKATDHLHKQTNHKKVTQRQLIFKKEKKKRKNREKN